jgi:hypothetical protein
MFSLLTFLSKLLGGLDVDAIEAAGKEWLDTKGHQYPDIEEKTLAASAFLSAKLQEAKPELDPAKIVETVRILIADLLQGETGIDPDAHHGMV